jgi:FkbM family methyltransferase
MSAIRATGALGTAARWVRRARLGNVLRAGIDGIDRALLRAGVPPLAAEIDGVELRGYLRHRGFLDYVRHGMPEETYYRSLVLDAVDSQTTFVDAGAHIGVYTLLAARRARRVIAFEPDPYNVAALRSNVAAARCQNTEIHAEAVADRTGRATFRAFRSTFSGSLLPREVDEYRELETDVIRLDDALGERDLDDLVVKLDVEGAEPLALAGMRDITQRVRRLVLLVEVNRDALEAGALSTEALIDGLVNASFECRLVDETQRRLVPVRKGDTLEKGNLVCRRAFAG